MHERAALTKSRQQALAAWGLAMGVLVFDDAGQVEEQVALLLVIETMFPAEAEFL